MTSPDTIERVNLSRETLYTYRTFPGGTADTPEWMLGQVRQEIEILERIAQEVPDAADAIGLLIAAWRAFAETQKVRAH